MGLSSLESWVVGCDGDGRCCDSYSRERAVAVGLCARGSDGVSAFRDRVDHPSDTWKDLYGSVNEIGGVDGEGVDVDLVV